MKIRTGFVSNSSSSSFIIIYKAGCICDKCKMKSPDLVEMIENSRDCNNEIRAEGVEEVIAAIKSCDLYREESAEIIKKIGEIKPDESIIYCDISIHDSTLRNYLGNEFCKVIYRDDL